MRVRLFVFALLFTAALRAQSQPDASAAERPLRLEDAIALALDKNFDLKIQRLATENAEDSFIIADAAFDPTLTLSTARSYAQSTDGVTSQTGFDTRIGASQRLTTGATISGSGSLDRTRNRPLLTASLNPVYSSDVALSVRQPLLKNGGFAANRAALERARIGITRAGYEFTDSVLSLIRAVESAYYTLSFARSQLEVRRFSVQVAEELLEENRTRRDVGTAIDLDVLQAEVGLANARRALLLAEQTEKNASDNLLALINPFEFDVAPGPLAVPPIENVSASFDLSYKLARDNNPNFASTQLSVEQLKLDAEAARRNRLPTLDVGAALGYNTRKGSAGEAASDVWGSDGYNWQVDASLNLPWGMRADRARYRQSVNSLNRERIRLQQVDQDLLVQVRAAVRAVETNRENLSIATLAAQLSEQQYEAEKARYAQGVTTFRRVQEAKEDLDTARINELQALLNLRNALADLARVEASSLSRYRITLEP